MDKTDKRALYAAIVFGIAVGMVVASFPVQPAQAFTNYTSSHTQTYRNGLGWLLYRWKVEQVWSVAEGEVIADYDHTNTFTGYAPGYYYKGERRHAVTFKAHDNSYWRIATEIGVGFFFLTFVHAMTAKCYSTGSCYWYDNWT